MYVCVSTQGTPAETLLYQLSSDGYIWAPCWVVRWDDTSRQFEVEFPGAMDSAHTQQGPVTRQDSHGAYVTTGARPPAGSLKRKMVKRLNLRFMVRYTQTHAHT